MNPPSTQSPVIDLPTAAIAGADGPVAEPRRADSWISDFLVLTKARVNMLVVATAFVGFVLHAPLQSNGWRLLHTLIGTGLVAGAAAVANQIRERTFDRQMTRTRNRPLAAGRLPVTRAAGLSATLLGLGCLWLGIAVNLRALGCAILAFLVYALVYTPLKRVTPACTLVGAVAGALPVMIGWAATGAAFGLWAGVAFAVLLLWQMPHFLAIAWWRKAEYQQAGYRVLRPTDAQGFRTASWALIVTLAVVGVSFVPAWGQRADDGYGPAALVLGLGFTGFAVRFFLRRTQAAARWLFIASLFYLPALYSLMLLYKLNP